MIRYSKIFLNVLSCITIIFTAMSYDFMAIKGAEYISVYDNILQYTVHCLDDAQIDICETSEYIYSGIPITPKVTVKLGGKLLSEDIDYTVSYENNLNVGTATIRAIGKGMYKGEVSTTFIITEKDINDADVKADYKNIDKIFEFIGKDRTPIVKMSYNGKSLNTIADYIISYEDNFYPGEATLTITGQGNFKGEIAKKFTIAKILIGHVTIRTSFNSDKQLVVSVNNGSYSMTVNKDYSYTTVTDSDGNMTVTIRGMGENYTGTYVKRILAADNLNKPEVKITVDRVNKPKAKNVKKKKVQVTWKKMSGVSGYKIRYSTNKKFKKATTVTIRKNSAKYTIKKLKLKKTYYIQVRAYKVYHGEEYLGKWSKSKSIKVKK